MLAAPGGLGGVAALTAVLLVAVALPSGWGLFFRLQALGPGRGVLPLVMFVAAGPAHVALMGLAWALASQQRSATGGFPPLGVAGRVGSLLGLFLSPFVWGLCCLMPVFFV